MNRKSFLSSLSGVAAACALQCFGFVDKIKTYSLVIQQKLVTEHVVTYKNGQVWSVVPGKTMYRMAPLDFRDDSDDYAQFEDPDDAYRSAGFEPPELKYRFNKEGWTTIS